MSENELLVSATILSIKMVKFCYSQPKSLPLNKNVHSLRILREGAHGPWATFVGRGGAAVLFIFLFLF